MAEPTQTSRAFGKPPQAHAKTEGGLLSAFSFAQFPFITIIVILAASGLVPYKDILCVLLASLYIYIMSRYVFPPVTLMCPPSIYEGSKVLPLYITLAAIVGLFLPLAYILLGVTMGDKKQQHRILSSWHAKSSQSRLPLPRIPSPSLLEPLYRSFTIVAALSPYGHGFNPTSSRARMRSLHLPSWFRKVPFQPCMGSCLGALLQLPIL